ncbi:MAG: glycosyltransferase family 4 protein [Candidatus Muiribacteriota bacterium]
MDPVIIIIIFLISVFSQVVIMKISRKYNLYDMPGERKIHKKPVSRLGGIGVFIAFSAGFFLSGLYQNPRLLLIYTGSFLIFIINLFDDIKEKGINNKIKLLITVVIALIMYSHGLRVTLFLRTEWLMILLTVLWVTGITNSFNLLDNMNGLSSGITIIAAVFFAVVFYYQNIYELSGLMILLIPAVAGFFIFNFPKGKIFLGDAGANFNGFLLAAVSVTGTYIITTRLTRLPVIAPLLILSVPIYDTLSVIIIRKLKGYSIFRPDNNHISHRLVKMGFTNFNAVLMIFLISIITGISAIMLRDLYLWSALLLLGQVFIIYIFFTILVHVGKKN